MSESVLTGVLTVAVPVSDQDAAKSLLEQLGLETHIDAELQPGFRWIEMGLPTGDTSVSFVSTGPDLPAGIDTGIRLATADARAAHGRGSRRPRRRRAPRLADAPLMFSFVDIDGNRFYVTEASQH